MQVLNLVTATAKIADTTIATLSADNLTLKGVAAGLTNIQVFNPVTGASIGFTLVELAISVVGIDAASLTPNALAMSFGDQSALPLTSTRTGTITVATPAVLQFEGDTASIVASAVFSDGSRMLIDSSLGLVLQTSSADVLVMNSTGMSVSVARNAPSASGPLVTAIWTNPSTCVGGSSNVNQVVASGFVDVSVTIPNADTVELLGVAPRLVRSTDAPGVACGLPTSLALTVRLISGSRVIDVTLDDRTVFDISLSNSLLAVVPSTNNQGRLVVLTSGSAVGEGILIMCFLHHPIAINVTIRVVSFAGTLVVVHLFPEYPGSQAVNVTTLYTIHGTNPVVLQLVTFHVFALFSDGVYIDVTSFNSLIQYRVIDPDSASTSTLLAVQQSSTGKFVTFSLASATMTGSAQVSETFSSFVNSSRAFL